MSDIYRGASPHDHIGMGEEFVQHHGVMGMKWGVRRYQPYTNGSFFISGSSKTQTKDSGYYRKKLPKGVRNEIKKAIKKNENIIVGDAPGVDRQVQEYLKKKNYNKVHVYGPGKQVRYLADPNWETHPIDAPEFEVGSKEWLAKKDIVMEKASTHGLAVTLDEGSKATRMNVNRLLANNKDVSVYELNKHGRLFDRKVDSSEGTTKSLRDKENRKNWSRIAKDKEYQKTFNEMANYIDNYRSRDGYVAGSEREDPVYQEAISGYNTRLRKRKRNNNI